MRAGANEEVEIENASRGSYRLTSVKERATNASISPQLTPHLPRVKIE